MKNLSLLIAKIFIGGFKHSLAGIFFNDCRNVVLVVEEKNGRVIKDNGYCFIRYLTEKGLMQGQAYLVVDKFSDNIPRSYQVKYGSLKHYGLVRRLSFILFTHNVENAFPVYLRDKLMYRYLVDSWALSHGVYFFKKPDGIFTFPPANISVKYQSSHTDCDGVVNKENNLISMNTGMCRWDFLEDRAIKDSILFLPTWRRFRDAAEQKVVVDGLRDKINYIHDAFLGTHYKLTIILHRYIRELLQDDRITTTNDIASYIRNSEILITDYSSVFADFQVLGKKVYLYAPDETTFQEKDVGLFNRPSDVCVGEFLVRENIRLMKPVVSPLAKGECCEKTYHHLLEILEANAAN